MGSGRWYRWNTKPVVEDYRRIDVRDWHRKGQLRAGVRFCGYLCNADGEKVASIDVWVEQEQVRLVYRVQQVGSEGQDQDLVEPVCLTWTGCHYGGQRPWFLCPGGSCGRRVAVLYLAGRDFRCRGCCALTYESQREDRKYRAVRRAQKTRRRLGGDADLGWFFPDKPKRMRWATYERLKQKAEKAEHEADAAVEEWLGVARKGARHPSNC